MNQSLTHEVPLVAMRLARGVSRARVSVYAFSIVARNRTLRLAVLRIASPINERTKSNVVLLQCSIPVIEVDRDVVSSAIPTMIPRQTNCTRGSGVSLC